MEKALILLVLVLNCCTWNVAQSPYKELIEPDIVVDLLVYEYESRNGDIGEECRQWLYNVEYVEVDECGIVAKEDVDGIHKYTDTHSCIWIDDTLTPMSHNGTLVHELIHALLSCLSEGLGGDGEHNLTDIWCTPGQGCKWDGNDNDNSLEYAVAYEIRYFTQ